MENKILFDVTELTTNRMSKKIPRGSSYRASEGYTVSEISNENNGNSNSSPQDSSPGAKFFNIHYIGN